VIADNTNNIKLDYGNGDYDTRHLFTTTLTYDIPVAKVGPRLLTQGWQVSSLMNWHTGQPSDTTLLGLDLVGDPYAGISHKFSAAGGGTQWWNPAAFAVPTTGIGNLSRNKFHGPGYGDVDLSILKNIPLRGERAKVQLRAEMFNLFNRVNLASGPGSVGSTCGTSVPGAHCNTSAGFGLVSDTIGDFNGAPGIGPGEAFNMQLAIKIIF
jgi:hypothetical protein